MTEEKEGTRRSPGDGPWLVFLSSFLLHLSFTLRGDSPHPMCTYYAWVPTPMLGGLGLLDIEVGAQRDVLRRVQIFPLFCHHPQIVMPRPRSMFFDFFDFAA